MEDHAPDELRLDEDANGLFIVWVCECGETGRAVSQQTAHTGWRKHAERAYDVWCGGVR